MPYVDPGTSDEQEVNERRKADMAKKIEMEVRLAAEQADAEKSPYGSEDQYRLDQILDRIQFLAYVSCRIDVPYDHPQGIGVLDPAFAMLRLLLRHR